MPRHVVAAAILLLFTLFHEMPEAAAGCYETVGCTDKDYFSGGSLSRFSCQSLAFLRNSIYAENGYCFKSPQYSAIFLRETCRFNNDSDVPLNDYERANIFAIVETEHEMGCY